MHRNKDKAIYIYVLKDFGAFKVYKATNPEQRDSSINQILNE